jgi:hypothetical protein
MPPSAIRVLSALVLFLVSFVGTARAQVDEGWGSDADLCPRMVGMYTSYNQEQFTGTGIKERETYFWGRYRFTAYNQGGVGPIEMSGFFYISKAQCYYQEGRGTFIVVSPVIEYYGPRRDGLGECTTGGTELVGMVYEPGYDPYGNEPNGGGCGGEGGESGGAGGSSTCHQEWVIVEKSDDGGNTWYTIYEGWATVCE